MPLLLTDREWATSEEKDIDVTQLKNLTESRTNQNNIGPVVDQTGFVAIRIPQSVREFFESDHKTNIDRTKEFYIHAIFSYNDLMGRKYWTYVKWIVRLIVVKSSDGNIYLKPYFSEKEYRPLNQ